MVVTVEVPGRGYSFDIEVNPFERVRDVKEKVRDILRIPISHQITFFFNGQPLQDDLIVRGYEIVFVSRMQLVVVTVADAANLAPELQPLALPFGTQVISTRQIPSSKALRVTLNVKLPNSKDRIPIEMRLNDTVLMLKMNIVALEGMQGVPVEAFKACGEGSPCVFETVWNVKVDVFMKQSLRVAGGSSSRKLKLKVVPMHTGMNIQIEVNAMEELHKTFPFRLPENGVYFLFHNQRQRVLNEAESFHMQQVVHDDTIETYDRIVFHSNAPPTPTLRRP